MGIDETSARLLAVYEGLLASKTVRKEKQQPRLL